MATYFTRLTHDDDCAGCGECVDICPVNAVEMKDNIPVVDKAWCIGCGVCSTVCATDAIEMILRPDKAGKLPAATVSELHQKIMKEKELK
jgi:MinD superfamily P-loop ATPase